MHRCRQSWRWAGLHTDDGCLGRTDHHGEQRPGTLIAFIDSVTGISTADQETYITFDITALVKEWVSGAVPNNGVAIKSASGGLS